jgi:hypothetical protein
LADRGSGEDEERKKWRLMTSKERDRADGKEQSTSLPYKNMCLFYFRRVQVKTQYNDFTSPSLQYASL